MTLRRMLLAELIGMRHPCSRHVACAKSTRSGRVGRLHWSWGWSVADTACRRWPGYVGWVNEGRNETLTLIGAEWSYLMVREVHNALDMRATWLGNAPTAQTPDQRDEKNSAICSVTTPAREITESLSLIMSKPSRH